MKNNINDILIAMIKYFGNDVRRINHALKGYAFSKSIGEKEGLREEELYILEVASILHDIGIKVSEEKYNSSAGNYQEIEGPGVARELLCLFQLEEKILDRICFLIGNHHSYSKIDQLDFQILVEADFLVNIYEDNIEKKNIAIVKERYFKTYTGIEYLTSMYL